MRARWIVGGLGGLALGASCILPAAEVLPGTGGAGGSGSGATSASRAASSGAMASSSASSSSASASSASTTSSTSSSSSGSLPVSPVQIVAPSMTTVACEAPSGTAGERHLLYAGGTWWALFLNGYAELDLVTSPDGAAWSAPSPVLPYAFGDSGKMVLDGRTFGLDVQTQGAAPIFHLSLSSLDTNTQDKSHARGTVGVQMGSSTPTIVFDGPFSLGFQVTNSTDGTVTAVTPSTAPGFPVADFGAVANDVDGSTVTEALTAFSLTDTPAGSGAPSFTFLQPLQEPVGARAALAYGSDFVAIWYQEVQSSLYAAVGPSTWQAATASPVGTLTASGPWAACGTTAGVHLVWLNAGSFLHSTLSGGVTTSWAMAQAPDLPSETPAEIFLACGTAHVYLFALAADGSISMSGWDGSDWSSTWTKVVAALGTADGGTSQRCHLSGFDRVTTEGSSGRVGLLWTESPGCLPAPTDLWTAIVPVAP